MRKQLLKSVLVALLAGAICLPALAQPVTADTLLDDLGSDNMQRRLAARPYLRRADVAYVAPKLVDMLRLVDNEHVWRAAFSVLSDLANMTGVPGREADRLAVTDAIAVLLAPAETPHLKRQAMRLLPLCVPEGYDLSPIAALLDDAELRERARACLREINTDAAAEALVAQLRKLDNDPVFQVAILRALAVMHSNVGARPAYRLTDSNDAGVRAAAAQVLARTGSPRVVEAVAGVAMRSTPETRFDATDAVLRLANNIALNGGNWETAINLYRAVLTHAQNPVTRGGAMVGLGKYGDETVLPDILAALKADTTGDLFGPGLAALEYMGGKACGEALLAAYDDFPADMRLMLLGVFGRKQDPMFLGPLNEQVRSTDPAFRKAALDALVQTGLPGAAPGVVAYAVESEGAERAELEDAVKRMAEQFRMQGHAEGAGAAFLGLYRLADTEEEREFALDGIQQFPTNEAFAYVMGDLDTNDLGTLSNAMLVGMTRALKESGRDEEAAKAYDAFKKRLNTTEAVLDMWNIAPVMGDGQNLATRMGFITKWKVVGPFPWASSKGFSTINVNEPDVDLSATYTVDGGPRAWELKDEGQNYIMNLAGYFGNPANCTAYAYTEISVPAATDVTLRMGSDDGIKVWLNGEVAHENNVDRGATVDQDQTNNKLKAGVNRILVEVTQGGGGWNFLLRLTTPDGMPLAFENVLN